MLSEPQIADFWRYISSQPPGHRLSQEALNLLYVMGWQQGWSQTQPVFDSKILVKRERLLNHDIINAALVTYLHSKGFEADGSESLGIRSDERLIIRYGNLDHSHSAMIPVVAAVEHAARNYCQNIPQQAASILGLVGRGQFRLRSFAAATKGAGYHFPHMHGGALLVATYYVTTPSADPEGSSRLIFGFRHKKEIYDVGWLRPMAGDILIFPSYFWHSTTPPNTEQFRINIGFDVCGPEPIKMPVHPA